MQTTSQLWKDLWASGTAWLDVRAVIAGQEYTDFPSVPIITRGAMQEGLGIGNAVSAMCALSLRPLGTIPKAAEVQVSIRLNDGATVSEWLPAGTFYVSRRSLDPVTGVLSLECYDALLKANAVLTDVPWTTETGEVMTTETGEWMYFNAAFPCAMADLAADIALLLGTTIDHRTEIGTGAAYVVNSLPEGASIHDALAAIATANGGNWIITPAGQLRLVPLVDCADAATALSDVVDVDGVTVSIGVPDAGTVTGIRYSTDGGPVVLGSEDGIVIDAGDNAAAAQALYDDLAGMVYQPYTLVGAVYDPAAEIGDYVRAGANGEVNSALYTESATLAAAFRGSISAPQSGELSDEYPYIGGAANKALVAAKAYAQEVAAEAVEGLNDALDQEAIFNRLTNNGAAQGIYMLDGQLYVNMSYARSGILILGGLNNVSGRLEIQDANGNVIGSWGKDGFVATKGTFSGELNGATGTFSGEMSASGLKGGTFTAGGADNANGQIEVLDADGDLAASVDNDGFTSYSDNQNSCASLTAGGVSIRKKAVSGTEWGWFDVMRFMNSAGVGSIYSYGEMRIDCRKVLTISNAIPPTTPQCSIIMDNAMMTIQAGYSTIVLGTGTNYDTVTVTNTLSASNLESENGASGTFTTADGKTVTVYKGIITGIA